MSQITTALRCRVAVAFGISLFGVAVAACDPPINGVRVQTGTVPLHPVFVLTDSAGRGRSGTIYGLSVVPCGADSAVWQLAATGSNGAPAQLTYGETPPGFVTQVGPQPLRAGCYDVFITDGRRARFRVDRQGRVIPETKADTTAGRRGS